MSNLDTNKKPNNVTWDIKLFKYKGTPVILKPLFFLLPFLLINLGEPAIEIWKDTSLIIHIFLGVLIHELAHARSAYKWGYKTSEIFINVLGGGAKIDPEFMKNDKHHLRIAFAGPLSNFLLAALFFVIGIFTVPIGNPFITEFVVWGIGVNAILGLFNMIPVIPLDGARVFKSLFNIYINKGKKENKHKERTAIAMGSISLICSLGLLTAGYLLGDIILLIFSFIFVAISVLQLRHYKEDNKKS